MKKTVLVGILALVGSMSFAQSLGEQIEAQVTAQAGQQDAQDKAAEHARNNPGNHQLRVDSTDSRIVTVNGKKFYLQKPSVRADDQRLLFVSNDNDTVQVERTKRLFAETPYYDGTVSYPYDENKGVAAGYTATSHMKDWDGGERRIVGAAKEDANGNSSYVVEGSTSETTALPKKRKKDKQQYEHRNTTITVKQHNIRPENRTDIRGGTYQGVLNTPDSTFNRTFKSEFLKDATYGPESYYK